MINNRKNIRWADSYVDPGSRVFFIGNHVFRAIEESRLYETLEFLNSECYAELRKRDLIVNTWRNDDIKIDGYPLILEHERLTCMPEEWYPFDMLKDVLLFQLEINELCHRYGFGIRDIGYGNVTLKKGHLCFLDFGSFRKAEKIDNATYSQYCLPLAFLPVAMQSKNDGNDYLAECFIKDYDNWQARKCRPTNDLLVSETLLPYLHPIAKFYRLRIKRHNIPFNIHSKLSINSVILLNKLANTLLPSKYQYKKLIKIQSVFSVNKAISAVERLQFPYLYSIVNETVVPSLNMEEVSDILNRVHYSHKKIVLWGQFLSDDISKLCQKYTECLIVIMSSDRIYANGLYADVSKNFSNLFVVCNNAMRGKDSDILKHLRCDVLIPQKDIWQETFIGTQSNWAEKASYFANYILISAIAEQNLRDNKLNNFWQHEEKSIQYVLYKNITEQI